jgi:hypothetical protein
MKRRNAQSGAKKEWTIAPADGEKIKNEFPVEDRLDGIVEALKELEESEDE